MENIYIEGQKELPTIDFKTNGQLKLSGKSYPENSAEVFEPLKEFITKLEVSKIEFDINLDYLNTSSTKYVENLIQLIEDSDSITEATINWIYEDDDEENLELGEILEERVDKSLFIFHAKRSSIKN